MRTYRLWVSGWMVVACILCSGAFRISNLNAQAPGTGAILGKVTDPTGAVIPNAEVQITSVELGASRQVITSADGVYRGLLLPPGTYSVTVRVPGFQTKVLRDIQVVVTETTVVDVSLEVGTVETKIEVTASPEIVQATSATLGRATAEEVVRALPLANRNFTQILGLSPGIAVELANAGQIGVNSQNVSANGARQMYNNFQFNGVDANNIAQNSASGSGPQVGLAIPAPDTIAEFKVQTGLYDASYGRGAGGNIDIVSKSGTNEFHGNVWEFFRNEALNANDFFLNRSGQRKPVLKQHQFGFTFSGPVQKDRTFFLGSYQGTRQRNGVSPSSFRSAFLPPLTSDRSRTALGALFGGKAGAFGGVAVASDGSNINPVALALLNFKFPDGSFAIPNPQLILPGGLGQFSFSSPARSREDQFSVHMDHILSARNHLAGRFFYSSHPSKTPFARAGPVLPGWGDTLEGKNVMLTLSDTHAFSSKLINQIRFGYMRFDGARTIDEPILNSDVGITPPTGRRGIPFITVVGLFQMGPTFSSDFSDTTNTFVWSDMISYVLGRHSLRTGVEVKRHQNNANLIHLTYGSLSFLSFPDFLLGMSAAQNGTAFSNVSGSQAANGIFEKAGRYIDFATFLQDDIRISPKFTLNAGLRYEFIGPPTEIRGRFSSFDLNIAEKTPPITGTYSGLVLPANFKGVLPEGVTKRSQKGLWRNNYKNFGPRLGFTWRFFDRPRLVLRGGYGIYFQRVSGQYALQTILGAPFVAFSSNFGGANAAATFQVPFNPPVPPVSAFPRFDLRLPGSAQGVATLSSPTQDTPYMQQYSLNVQYEFVHDFMLEAGYVGSKSTHLPFCRGFNQALIATPQNPVHGETATSVTNVAKRTPWLGISPSAYLCETVANSNYNSLQSSVTKRFSRGLQFLAAYTWSKSLDVNSGRVLGDQELSFQEGDQTNLRATAYGPSLFDRTHRFVLSFVYELPDLRKGPRVLQKVVSGWQFSGIMVRQSGIPFSIVDSRGASIFGVGIVASYAQCTGAQPVKSGSVQSRLNEYFNKSAFAPAPRLFDGTGFGNCGKGILRGPSQRNIDLSVQKTISLTKKSNLQFRTEFFNLTNTPNFALPGNNVAAPLSFGVISATVGNPRIIQFALKYNF